MAALALPKHPAPIINRGMVTLPAGRVTISTPSWFIAMLFSLSQSNALPFNPHSSPSGSVQRILSAVPAERSPLTAEDLAAGTTDRMLFVIVHSIDGDVAAK